MNEVILVCEDDKDILTLISYNLRQAGYRCIESVRGDEVVEKVLKEKPSVILLDVMLPGENGLALCRQIRANTLIKEIPIILVSAKAAEHDRILGLEAGADDYVTKPFSMNELVARVRAAVRRQDNSAERKPLNFAKLNWNKEAFKVYIDNNEVSLTLMEFSIFIAVADRQGKVITRDELAQILDPQNPVSGRSIDVHVFSLRKKLNDRAEAIETIRGVGYRFRHESLQSS